MAERLRSQTDTDAVLFDLQPEKTRNSLAAGVRLGDLVAVYDEDGRTLIVERHRGWLNIFFDRFFGERPLKLRDYAPRPVRLSHSDAQDNAEAA